MSGPRDLTPREAVNRWLSKQRIDKTEATMSTYWYRLKQIVEFCESQGIESMSDLSAWELDEFDTQRRQRDPKAVTLSREYRTMNQFLEWAESVELGEPGISAILKPPKTSKDDEVNKERLMPEVARANLQRYRGDDVVGGRRACVQHAFLELMWFTGARLAAIRGLDLADVDPEAQTVQVHHRPDKGTDIKQAYNPERVIGLTDATASVLADYRDHNRHDVFDDENRRPFLTSSRGRVGESTLRRYSYYATLPCFGGECPHDRDPDDCEWATLREASGCPSSRSPHKVRTGAITNMRNRGWSLDDVAERVNTSPQRIKEHYDHPDLHEQYEERRSEKVNMLRLDESDDDKTDETQNS